MSLFFACLCMIITGFNFLANLFRWDFWSWHDFIENEISVIRKMVEKVEKLSYPHIHSKLNNACTHTTSFKRRGPGRGHRYCKKISHNCRNIILLFLNNICQRIYVFFIDFVVSSEKINFSLLLVFGQNLCYLKLFFTISMEEERNI